MSILPLLSRAVAVATIAVVLLAACAARGGVRATPDPFVSIQRAEALAERAQASRDRGDDEDAAEACRLADERCAEVRAVEDRDADVRCDRVARVCARVGPRSPGAGLEEGT